MITGFPKILRLDSEHIALSRLFHGPVEVTEKVDGSYFAFGIINGVLCARSKGQQLDLDNPPGMFREGVEYIRSIEGRLPQSTVFHCEYLQKPKHNVLRYNRIPKNHLVLFAAYSPSLNFWSTREFVVGFAAALEIDIVQQFVCIDELMGNAQFFDECLKHESFLGGPKIEGVVIKNYAQKGEYGGKELWPLSAKIVSPEFKEVHKQEWSQGKDKVHEYFRSFATEARWQKAVQHLRDQGKLTNTVQDIGLLLKEVNVDTAEEEKEEIKEFLWNHYSKDFRRVLANGFPQWYKSQLAGVDGTVDTVDSKSTALGA